MTGLGMDGEQCGRCRERHLLVEFEFGTTSVFTQDRETVRLCRPCLDEFVSGKVDRVKYKVNSNGVPMSASQIEWAMGAPMHAGDHIYYQDPSSQSEWPMEATLYGWTNGHV